ncbi:MAG TPA: hypothetical protein VGG89_17710 [Candidatus Baltobacteraceae bacterium]|jgi:hypothetical protein
MKFGTIVAILSAAAVTLSACASHRTTTIQTSSGNATVTTSQDNKSVTVRNKEGTTSIGQNVDASKLGAPVYPGAQANEQGAISSSTDKGTSVMAGFKTSDPFEKVEAFYKQQLPAGSEKMNTSANNSSIASFQIGTGDASDQVAVQVTSSKAGETDILITHVVTDTKPTPYPSAS